MLKDSQVRAVGRVTRLWAGWSGFQILAKGAQSASIQCVIGPLPPKWVKQSGSDVNPSPPYTTKVKNEWSYTSTPLICHHVKHKETFLQQRKPFMCVLICNTPAKIVTTGNFF